MTSATSELLQTLIRNQCVNDGTPDSGQETRNADVLQSYVEGPGVTIERWEPTPGRASFVARVEVLTSHVLDRLVSPDALAGSTH